MAKLGLYSLSKQDLNIHMAEGLTIIAQDKNTLIKGPKLHLLSH